MYKAGLYSLINKFNWRMAGSGLSLCLFTLALWILFHMAHTVHLSEIQLALTAIPAGNIIKAIILVIAGYMILTFYDVLALRQIQSDIPYPRIALASFIAYAFAHNIGLSVVSGGTVRYRIYSAAGLSAADIGTVIFLVAYTFGLGVTSLVGLVLILEPQILSGILPVPATLIRIAGGGLLFAVLTYLSWSAWQHRPFRLFRWQFEIPPIKTSILQIALVMVDLSLFATVIYQLLPSDVAVSYPHVLGAVVLSLLIGIISHVPGGLGVFETAMILALPQVPKDAMLATLLVFRVLYYLIPFLAAALLLAIHEWKVHSQIIGRWSQTLQGWLDHLLPEMLGMSTLLAGAILLFSSATPTAMARRKILSHLIPLPLLEASHLLASVTGFGLLILARGLFNRLDGAWYLSIWLLILGIAASLSKGLDYEEAIFMALVLGLLWYGRKAFYRKASLLNQAFTPGWLLMIGVICAGSLWLGLFTYKHVDYSSNLWWTFAFHADAPRFMRASVVVVVLAIGFALFKLIRQIRPEPELPDVTQIQKANVILSKSPKSDAALALAADKYFMFSSSEKSFLMYQVQGKSWIVLGDPVGCQEEFEELLWTFREQCDLHGAHAVFYEVSPELLPYFIDMGLDLLKLGEEALINLSTFSLEGKSQAEFRHILHKAEREQIEFSVVSASDVEALLPELKIVSDNWLEKKKTREKRFSLGSFSPEYLKQFPCALIHIEGRIVAFANIWCSGQHHEVSIDLMRYSDSAPKGVMDILFVELILWSKAQGYQWFNLGMAPLAGLERHRLAPVWHQLGNLIFRHGENF